MAPRAHRVQTLADGRYEVLASIPNLQDLSYITVNEHQTLVVRDTRDSRYRTIRLVKLGTRSHEKLVRHLDVLKRLDIHGPHPLLLAPVDSFETNGKGAKQLGVVYDELLGPDMDTMNGHDPNNHHEPELVRHLGFRTALALQLLHVRGIIGGLSTRCPVATFPALAEADANSILKFYGYDGKFACLNASCTGPEGIPSNMSAVLYKYDQADPTAEFAKQFVPEAVFGESISPKSDMWMLGYLLYHLTAQIPPEHYGIISRSCDAAEAAIVKLPPSAYKGIVRNIELLGDLPPRYVSRLPRDARGVVERKAVKFDPGALFRQLRNNTLVGMVPQENRIKDEDLELLVDLLYQLLKYDPEGRIPASEVLESPYFSGLNVG